MRATLGYGAVLYEANDIMVLDLWGYAFAGAHG